MDTPHRILIVSDDAAVADSLERTLIDPHWAVSSVPLVVSDIERAGRHEVSLLILHVGNDQARAIEVMVGLRRIERLRAVPTLAIVERPEQASALLDAGASDFVIGIPPREELRVRVASQLREKASDPVAQVVLELTQTLVSSVDFQEILYAVVRRIANVVQVDRVSIVLIPDSGNTGYVVAASDDAAVSSLRLDLTKYPEIRHVIRTKVPLTVSDVDTHPLLDGVRTSFTGMGLSALTLIPIVWDDQAMGVIFIRAASRKGALSPQQTALCQVLANATAIALRNARLMQSLRDKTQSAADAQQRAEKRLRSLRRYADLFASSVDGIAAFNSEGITLFANPGACRILGYEEKEIVDHPVWNVVDLSEMDRTRDMRSQFRRGQVDQNVDLTIIRKDGKRRIINCSFSLLSGADRGGLVSFRDVTEARQTEAELVKTKTFLESLIEASVDAIVAANMRGTIILFNRGAERIYGYKASDVLHKMSVKALYPGHGAREVGRMLDSEKYGGVGRLEPIRIEVVNQNGQTFPISLSAAVIHEDGKATATFGIFTDLRDRIRVEEQLAQAQEKLAVSEKQALIAEVAGATAHELNQPLTSVMGYAELLRRKLDRDSPGRHAADVIYREAERMAEIVRKIGKLTRYETKSYVGQQKIIDLDRSAEADPETERE